MSNKRKQHYPMFEKTSSEEEKKRKKDQPLLVWSWNVAGLRACVKKDGDKAIAECKADVVLLQETKCPEFPAEIQRLEEYGWKKLLVSSPKAGYSGVAMLSKEKPIKVEVTMGDEEYDKQGRYIQAEFEKFFLITAYVPNSGQGLVNLARRKAWDEKFRARLVKLDKQKPVICVGDLNVAHNEIDLHNPDSNRNKTAGFTDQERNDFTKLLEAGPFVDVYRRLNPEKEGAYTYWTYIGGARSRNVGWRLDYTIVSERLFDSVKKCTIHKEILGSDHCPISLSIDI